MDDRSTLRTLQVGLDANAAAYRRAVQAGAPGQCWDFVVLTAANEKQAEGYRQELALRSRAVGPTGAFFPAIQRSVVVPDPPGRRAGSGGATLGVMEALCRDHGVSFDDLRQLRVLLIHSGGASQRLPAYSPLGKIFAPLPLLRPDGQIATLFDHLYLTLAGLPERLGPGMLVLAGDVFLLFDHREVSAPPPPGVTALSMRVEPELALGHGVFVTDRKGRIRQTLQKVPAETMRRRGATDEQGRVLIDTGLLFFDPDQTTKLAQLAGAGRRGCSGDGLHARTDGPIDLYDDITAALARDTEAKEYLATGGAARDARRVLWRSLHGTPFQVMQLAGQFLHLGTTRQFRDAMTGRDPSPAAELFQRNVLAHTEWPAADGARVYHGALLADEGGRGGTLGAGSVVEHSILGPGARVGRGSVVSQVYAPNEPVELGDELLLVQVPVRTDQGAAAFVHVVCGVGDDFKGRYDQGACVYLNRPIDEWLAWHGIRPDEVWPGVPANQRTLWTARLFPATRRRDDTRAAHSMSGNGRARAAKWRKAERWSMAMLLEHADPQALIEHREIVAAYLQTEELLDAIRRREDRPLESIVGHYASAAAYRQSEDRLERWALRPAGDDPAAALDQARARWAVVQLLQRPDHPQPAAARSRIEDQMRAAFAKVAEASEIGHARVEVRSRASSLDSLTPGVEVVATAPVRLDLAGGWSDTPPYCFERGGHVVNVAIDLEGKPPVRAVVRTLAEPKLVLESHDLGRKVELTKIDARPDGVDVRDPFALHHVALRTAGLLPDGHGDVARHLRSLGAGLHVVTESRVPKGSGLGTSSILAATLLAALHRLRGAKPSRADLIEQTLLLEQRLGTGGGWQDQVGGIFPGVKSTTTPPGVPQRPNVEALGMTDRQYDALQERMVVYFSGQQRLARDILRRVMGRWLAREPAVVGLMASLKQGAGALRAALLCGRWREAGREVGRYWQIKKELYPGSTTPAIDLLFLETRDDCLAAGLAGAGGGGFAYFLCADARQAKRLQDRLAAHAARPGSLGSVYAAQINRDGLKVSRRNV